MSETSGSGGTPPAGGRMLPNSEMVEAIMRWKFETVWRMPLKLLSVQANPALMASISDERARLSALTYSQLLAEYRTAQQQMADAREAALSFNRPAARATETDYDYWSRMDSWTIDEAVALLLDRAPDRVNTGEIMAYCRTSPFAMQYARLREMARRSQILGGGLASIPRDRIVQWATSSDIPFPPGLHAALAQRNSRAVARILEIFNAYDDGEAGAAQPIDPKQATTAPPPADAPAIATAVTPAEELVRDRRARRLARFRALGGEMRRAGESWHQAGEHGALAELAREETERGRPMSDRSDVRRDLIAALEAERKAGG